MSLFSSKSTADGKDGKNSSNGFVRYFIIFQIFGAIVAIALFALPTSLSPVLWSKPFPLPSLPPVNHRLAKVQKLAEHEIMGPESLAFAKNGDVFTGLSDGRIVMMSQQGVLQGTIFFNGAINTKNSVFTFNNQTVYENAASKMAWCTKEANMHKLQFDVSGESSCGRPLGLRYVQRSGKQRLYVVDAYKGVYMIELNSKNSPQKLHHLISLATPITFKNGERHDNVTAYEPKFFNDLDVSEDENFIYFTDSSYKYYRSQNRQEILDGAPRGRLFAFDVIKKSLSVLLCGLHFPNGVQLVPGTKSSELLVVELTRFRVLKINLDKLKLVDVNLIAYCGEHGSLAHHMNVNTSTVQAAVQVFFDRAPGLMDNIRLVKRPSTPKGAPPTYIIGAATKSAKPFSLLWTLYQNLLLRHIIGRVVNMQYIEKLVPKYGLVFLLDAKGNLIESYQDPRGKVSLLSEAQFHPISDELWLGSHSNAFVAKVPPADLLQPNDPVPVTKKSKTL